MRMRRRDTDVEQGDFPSKSWHHFWTCAEKSLASMWLLKHWDNSLLNRWSAMKSETASHFYS